MRLTHVIFTVVASSLLLVGCATPSPGATGAATAAPTVAPTQPEPVGCLTGPIAPGDEVRQTDITGAEVSIVGGECFDIVEVVWPEDAQPGGSYFSDLASAKVEFCDQLGVETPLNELLGHGYLVVGVPIPPGATETPFPNSAGSCNYNSALGGGESYLVPDVSDMATVTLQWMTDGTSRESGSIYHDFLERAASFDIEPIADMGDSAASWCLHFDDPNVVSCVGIATVEAAGGGPGTFARVDLGTDSPDPAVGQALKALLPDLLRVALDKGHSASVAG